MKSNPTPLQKRAIDNIVSGRFRSNAAAMRDAGYSRTTSLRALEKLGRSKGVEVYLKSLGAEALRRWNMSIQEKVIEVYLDGLDATRLVGRKNIEYPDWKVRLATADKFSEFLGWVSK